MTAIWFILAFMTAAAVFALLWPLSRRPKVVGEDEPVGPTTQTRFYEDQLAEIERDLGRGLIAPAEAEAAKTEAARRLLRASREDAADARPGADLVAEPRLRQRRAASAFALSTIPLVALLVYGVYGSPNLPSQTEADRKAAQSGGQDLLKAIGQIEAKLASDPDDIRGWSVIAPVYMRLGRYDDAARAYGAVVRIKGEDSDALASWGEALVAAGEGNVSPEARQVFERALALDAKATKPQFYLARADELAGDPAAATGRLEALAAQGPPDAPWMGLVRENLSRLKGLAGPTAAVPEAGPKQGGNDEAKPEAKPDASASGGAANLQSLPPAERMAAIRSMVEGLDRRLDKQGGTLDEWQRLVRSYGALGERDKAATALQRARAALSGDARALAQLDAQAGELGLAAPGGASPNAGKGDGNGPGMPPGPANSEAAAAIQAMPAAERDTTIRAMVAGLDRRLSAKGGSADEWMRLVRSYSALNDRDQASGALDRAKMALAADADAVTRLDTLGRELNLRTADAKR